jgi:hypothetical protein
VTKAQVGLSNVDNVSDLDKPISNLTQAALNQKQATLVSGVNIRTVSGQNIVGSGGVSIPTIFNTSSPLTSNRIITLGAFTLAFPSSGVVNGFSVDGTTFSIDTLNNRIGIGTASPTVPLQVSGIAKFGGYQVSTLPTGVAGSVTYVTDALNPSYRSTVQGGGSTVTPVFFDGVNWLCV